MTADACDKLFAAATPPKGGAPTDTLTAAQSIARYPWYQPERLFALLDQFYPVPKGKIMRAVPFMPYLGFAPSAWVLPLKFDGGGYRAGGKAMFDSQGNLWVGRQFHRRLAGPGHFVARQLRQVRPERSPALADHDRFFRRRVRRRHLRCGRRRQRQCLAHQLRRHGDLEVRQERQVAGGAGRHHLQRSARTDAGRDRHTEQRCLGRWASRRPSSSTSRRATRPRAGSSAKAGRSSPASRSSRRSTSASTSRTGSG